jgi:tetratricopeptide (TPR) repeat protein
MVEYGNYSAGIAYLQESDRFFREVGRGLIYTNHCMGNAAYYLEDFNLMAACFQDALESYQQMGEIGFSVHYLRVLGTAYKRLGKLHQSARYYLDSITNAHELDDKRCLCMALSGLAGVAVAAGQPVCAVHILGAVETAYKTLNKTSDMIAQKEADRDTVLAHTKLDESVFAYAWSEGMAMGLEEAIREADSFVVSLTSQNSTQFSTCHTST